MATTLHDVWMHHNKFVTVLLHLGPKRGHETAAQNQPLFSGVQQGKAKSAPMEEKQ